MATLSEIQTWLDDRLATLLTEYDVPGAAVAVSLRGEVIDTAAGVLSLATGVDATADSVFQVGSITKVWTATLVMQLVDEGLVKLDAPVRDYVPGFVVADEAAAAAMTVRQLLNHTAGFEGDIFIDTGNGDDCVEKYVAQLAGVTQLFAPGEMFSYNNAAFSVLGRLVELARNKPFAQCLRDHLVSPLGLTHVANDANEAILHRAAVGHIKPAPDADLAPAPVWSLMRSMAPAGAMLAMRPRDLVAFAQLHLDAGKAPDGTEVVSPSSVAAMQGRQVELPPLGMMGDAWGLGWEIFDWSGRTVIGHDGGTIGQGAFLRIVPEQELSVALLTNGGNLIGLYEQVVGHVLRELAGIAMPPLPTPPAEREPLLDATRYAGTYTCDVADITVSQDADGRVWLDHTPKGEIAELGGKPDPVELVRLDGDTLIALEPQHGMHQLQAFIGDDGSGRALYLHSGRAMRRADGAPADPAQ
ncbi:beta-lactamase [Kribbella flavida DSM 17836]|uniref:Beta-lactamase n=1 Tax=Kribbella flavida (strain DSM 17836 / JCM 10339 / NBRC 14399) TaxID=479435 RepID=D2Q1Y1_KRIFD|nr:serine hydrolase domain-containing protein [Kribbella flavida]ADB33927.1 beta-lactamase [Kribbella flavida DSM 17836]